MSCGLWRPLPLPPQHGCRPHYPNTTVSSHSCLGMKSFCRRTSRWFQLLEIIAGDSIIGFLWMTYFIVCLFGSIRIISDPARILMIMISSVLTPFYCWRGSKNIAGQADQSWRIQREHIEKQEGEKGPEEENQGRCGQIWGADIDFIWISMLTYSYRGVAP